MMNYILVRSNSFISIYSKLDLKHFKEFHLFHIPDVEVPSFIDDDEDSGKDPAHSDDVGHGHDVVEVTAAVASTSVGAEPQPSVKLSDYKHILLDS